MASLGKMVLKSVPTGEARVKLVNYLLKLYKNVPKNKVESLVSNANKKPVVLTKNIPKINAEKIISNLNKLGATAVFVLHDSGDNSKQPGQISPKVTIKENRKPSNPKKSRGLASSNKAVQSQPKEVKEIPTSHKTKPVRPSRAFVLILILLLLTGGLLYSKPEVFQIGFVKRFVNQNISEFDASNFLTNSVNQSQPYYLIPNSNPIEQFDLHHSAYFDQRVVEGMKEAFESYAKLFALKPQMSVKVKLESQQVDISHFLVAYNVSINNVNKIYKVTISTDAKALANNIKTLENTLEKFSNDFSEFVTPLSSVKRYESPSASEILPLLSSFDYQDMFEVVRKVEKEISSSKCDPQLLLYANEVFSWLALFKNTFDNPTLANILSKKAVGTYLVASLFQKNDAPDLSFNEGLLLLGLDYPAQAIDKFSLNKEKRGETKALLTAYIKNNLDEIEAISKKQFINKKLAGYLLSRAYENSGLNNQAIKQYRELLNNYTDFLPAKEYAMDNSNVSLGRAYIWQYLGDVFEKHLYLTREFLNVKWIENDAMLQSEIDKVVTQGEFLEKWLSVHKKIISKTTATSGNGKLLSPDFVKSYLQEETFNAIYILYNLEANMLGRLSTAAKIVDTLQRVYPNSDLTHALRIKLFVEYEKLPPLKQYVSKIKMNDAGPLLLASLLDYQKWLAGSRPKEGAGTVNLLNKYRQKSSPNASGSYNLYHYYSQHNYSPVASHYLTRSELINPYNYYQYYYLSLNDDDGDFIERGNRFLKDSYGFTSVKGGWYSTHKKTKKAIESYEKCIKLSPEESTSYSRLGKIYKEQRRFNKAISTWKKYLKYDDSSLRAVSIKNKISKTYMEIGQNKKAYNILDKSKESYQMGALINYALSSEKKGNILQAEEYFKKASERYQTSSSPVELALFYMRQNNKATAIEVLREYERYNHYTYYFSKLLDYYIEQGEPRKAEAIVRKVRGNNYDIWVIWNLSNKYVEKNRLDIATELIKPLVGQQTQPYFFGGLYLDYVIKGNPDKQDKVFSEIILRLSDHPTKIEYFGISLVAKGHYDAAFKVFQKRLSMDSRRADAAILFMALSWRAGSSDAAQKQFIVEKLKSHPMSDMHKTLTKYLIDEATEAAVFKEINDPNEACEAHYFMGLVKSQNDNKEEAMKHLLISLETKATNNIEYKYANDLLTRLNK